MYRQNLGDPSHRVENERGYYAPPVSHSLSNLLFSVIFKSERLFADNRHPYSETPTRQAAGHSAKSFVKNTDLEKEPSGASSPLKTYLGDYEKNLLMKIYNAHKRRLTRKMHLCIYRLCLRPIGKASMPLCFKINSFPC